MSSKKPGVWGKVPNIEQEAMKLVSAGILLKDDPVEALLVALRKACAAELEKLGVRLTKKALEKRFIHLVWAERRGELVSQFVAAGRPLADLYDHFKNTIPQRMIDEKARALRGHTVLKAPLAPSEAGLGRLLTSEEVELAMERKRPLKFREGTLKDPFVVPHRSDKAPSVLLVNGVHLGLIHNRILGENVFRCALGAAERQGDDAVVLTGGLFHLDLKRSDGLHATHRGRLSGIEFEPAVVDPEYRERATTILKDLPVDELAYYTLRERVRMLLTGLRKISTTHEGSPLFCGKIFVVFGLAEEEIIENAVQAEIRYLTIVRRLRVQRERQTAQLLLAHAQREGNASRVAELQRQIERCIAEEHRTIISNVMAECRHRLVAIITATLARWIEEAIPNSQVIAQGSTFLRIDGQTIEIHEMRNFVATESALDEFMRHNAGRRSNDGSLPDVVVIATPLSVNAHAATVQRKKSGTQATTLVTQIPCALDRNFLRDHLADVVRVSAPIEHLLRHPRFEPGVTRLRFAGARALCSRELISVEALKAGFAERSRIVRRPEPYIYIDVVSDEHTGNAWRRYYYDPQSRRWLSHSAAVKALFRRDFLAQGKPLPLHGAWALDDLAHGNHFGTQNQPHQGVELWEAIEAEFRRDLKIAEADGTPTKLLSILRTEQQRALEQLRLQGYHWTQTQMEAYIRYLRENTDFFGEILLRGLRSGLRFVGISTLLDAPYDTRDIGPIVLGTGNHFGATVEDTMTEGFCYAATLQDALRSSSGLRNANISELVRAPRHGNIFIGLGKVVAGRDGYPWTFSLRGNPSRKTASNGDPLLACAANVLSRGDFAGIFGGGHVLHLSGDIHRNGDVSIPGATVISCGPGVGNDPYGHRGFSDCDTSSLILGLPVHGPSAGPIRMNILNHDWVRDGLRDPSQKIDWSAILPNPF